MLSTGIHACQYHNMFHELCRLEAVSCTKLRINLGLINIMKGLLVVLLYYWPQM